MPIKLVWKDGKGPHDDIPSWSHVLVKYFELVSVDLTWGARYNSHKINKFYHDGTVGEGYLSAGSYTQLVPMKVNKTCR